VFIVIPAPYTFIPGRETGGGLVGAFTCGGA
jgi:hypothetical protein